MGTDSGRETDGAVRELNPPGCLWKYRSVSTATARPSGNDAGKPVARPRVESVFEVSRHLDGVYPVLPE